MKAASLFISGTDTGVGKTHVTCLLASALAEQGLSVAVLKPCKTGVEPSDDGSLPEGSDAALLAAAARCDAPPSSILPYAFPLAAAPLVAAAAAVCCTKSRRVSMELSFALFYGSSNTSRCRRWALVGATDGRSQRRGPRSGMHTGGCDEAC